MAEEKNYLIAVSAATQYLAEQSDESASRYVFAYTITIRNSGPGRRAAHQPPLAHHRRAGPVQEVRGLGVVGAQPLLKPGEATIHQRHVVATPVGTMRGSYQMVAEDGARFEASIPEFTLSIPRVLH
jgi:ApaG protein